MTVAQTHGTLAEPTVLVIQRWLPGPIERVWAYLTQSELRRQWLASGEMPLEADAPFELVWRNDELSDPPGVRPDGFAPEQRMQSRIIAVEPPHRLVFGWEGDGEVSMELKPGQDRVLLTITHRRLPLAGRTRLHVSAGWHAHLDMLEACMSGSRPVPFWDRWTALKHDYAGRIGATQGEA